METPLKVFGRLITILDTGDCNVEQSEMKDCTGGTYVVSLFEPFHFRAHFHDNTGDF